MNLDRLPLQIGVLALTFLSLLMAGCATTLAPASGSGAVTVRDHPGLTSRFDHAFYRHDGDEQMTAVLLQGDSRQPRRALVVRMFWRPRVGYTPHEKQATNATLHYLVFAGDQPRSVAVYDGAGFVEPRNQPGQPALHAEVREAVLELTDRSEPATDTPLQTRMTATFTAVWDEPAVARLLRQLDAQATQSLGYPRLVHR